MTWGRAEQNRAEVAPEGRTERSGKQKGFLQFPWCAQVSLPPASVVQCTFLFFLSSPEFWHFHFSLCEVISVAALAGSPLSSCSPSRLVGLQRGAPGRSWSPTPMARQWVTAMPGQGRPPSANLLLCSWEQVWPFLCWFAFCIFKGEDKMAPGRRSSSSQQAEK